MSKAVKARKRAASRAKLPVEPARQPSQERGERRVEEILDAAAEVIAEVGVEAATTNAIAARAGSSVVGSANFWSASSRAARPKLQSPG